MATQTTTAPGIDRARGRGAFWAGLGLAVLAIALMVGQTLLLKRLFVPWYLPAVTTFGALLLVTSVAVRRSVVRILALVLITALAGLEWYFIASLSKLPAYEGPARAGVTFPAFQAALADGRTFGDKDLRDGAPTVMTFFRGRW